MEKLIIFIICLLGIQCSPTTYQTHCFSDLKYDDYESSIDSTFNYVEDIKEFFIIKNK